MQKTASLQERPISPMRMTPGTGCGPNISLSPFFTRTGSSPFRDRLRRTNKRGLRSTKYIEGDRIPLGEAGPREIQEALSFLVGLKDLRTRPDAQDIPLASEACFSVETLFGNLDHRLSRLKACDPNGTPHRSMGQFLEKELVPALVKMKDWVVSRLDAKGQSCQSELPFVQRVLSPSDFGFHNALRRRSGSLAWLDFEYFGWDDAAKMASDFLLHPAMDLNRDGAVGFVAGILDGFPEIDDLPWRLRTLYPLYGLKWCFILLNEFVPSDLERRDFALKLQQAKEEIQWMQLRKAKSMLERVLFEHEEFPYC